MAKYIAQLESAAAPASNAGVAWLMGVANTGFLLTRVTIGVRASTSTPTSMQAVIGVNLVTTAGTTPVSGPAIKKKNPIAPAAQALWIASFTGAPTTATDDHLRIAFNTQSTVSLPTDLFVTNATTSGFGFINRDNALPASHQYVITVEWEE